MKPITKKIFLIVIALLIAVAPVFARYSQTDTRNDSGKYSGSKVGTTQIGTETVNPRARVKRTTRAPTQNEFSAGNPAMGFSAIPRPGEPKPVLDPNTRAKLNEEMKTKQKTPLD